jgi:hypothetical protein
MLLRVQGLSYRPREVTATYRSAAGLLVLVTVSTGWASGPSPLLLQHPTLSATQIAFVYAGDLWTAPRGGGVAQRLTAGIGTVSRPAFSPDGSEIAFTGDYNGNADVYLIPAGGGVPRQLTYHPAPDWAIGWTRDGKQRGPPLLGSAALAQPADRPRTPKPGVSAGCSGKLIIY